MMKQIAHVCFGTRDLSKTISFYKENFEAEIIHEFRNAQDELYGVFLQIAGGFCLEFFNVQDEPNAGNVFRHFCIEVDDINAAAEKFSSKGFKVEVRRGRTDKTLQFWIQDSNGVQIEFQEYDSESKFFHLKS